MTSLSDILIVPMLKKNRLFTPGPTPLLPSAQVAMASYGAHHRTADFRTLFARVLADLKELTIWGAEISDAGVKHLAAFTKLSDLVLENTEVTDA